MKTLILIIGLLLPFIGFASFAEDPCLVSSPTPGTVCEGGAIYLGSLSPGAIHYMTTPGGCGDIPSESISEGSGYKSYAENDFTVTCSGTDSLRKNYRSATNYCYKLVYGGYDNWYLPNHYELNLMYANRSALPGLAQGWYRSSTEAIILNARLQRFSDGDQKFRHKDHPWLVRCVRRF